MGTCSLGGSGRTGWLFLSSFCQTQNLAPLPLESLGKASLKASSSLYMTGVIVNKLLVSGLKR